MSQQGPIFQSSFDLFAGDEATYSDLPVILYPANEETNCSSLNEEPNGLPKGEMTEGYAVYIFTKHCPEKKTARCYYIVYQPTLWDNFTVQRQWGVIGSSRQQFYTEHFNNSRPALARIRRLIERSYRRGYRLSYAA
jgi:predicted DNA-binding WGR domain protein